MANAGKIREVGTDGVTVEAATPASQPGDIFPSGVILHYAGASAPTNWLICDGTAVSRATYAALFAIIGTTYGAGDGSTTFNLPDMRGKVAVGKHTSGTFTTLGATGGEENHTLSAAEMPVHNHGVSDPGHNHTVNDPGHGHSTTNPYVRPDALGGGGPNWGATTSSNSAGGVNSNTTGIFLSNGSTGVSINNAGSGSSHNTMPPYLVVHHIIKT